MKENKVTFSLNKIDPEKTNRDLLKRHPLISRNCEITQ